MQANVFRNEPPKQCNFDLINDLEHLELHNFATSNISRLFTILQHHHMLDPVLSPSTELAGFRMVIVFTTPCHFVRSLASSFPSPFFVISFSTCFFHVRFGHPLPLLPLTSNFKAFTITFSSSFLKT